MIATYHWARIVCDLVVCVNPRAAGSPRLAAAALAIICRHCGAIPWERRHLAGLCRLIEARRARLSMLGRLTYNNQTEATDDGRRD
jgi:hypothetical protein